MKARLLVKTAYQKQLDRKLFEAVGNGDRMVKRFATPNLARVKRLLRNGATLDHFLLSGPIRTADREAVLCAFGMNDEGLGLDEDDHDEDDGYSRDYKNAIGLV